MLSFYEMFHLLEADWRDRMGLSGGQPPLRRSRSVDPNAARGQGVGQVRQNKSNSKRIGDNWSGPQSMGLPVTNRDAELNAARRGERVKDVSHFDPMRMLDQQDPDAAKIFEKMRLNGGVSRGGTFSLRQLATMLGMDERMAPSLKKTLMLLSMLPKQAPVHISRRAGMGGGAEDVYKIDPLVGEIDNPDEDRDVLGPRQTNPALSGGRADRVGRPQPQAPPPAPLDRTPGSLKQLLSLRSAIEDILSGYSADSNPTKAIGMKNKIQELLPFAQKEIAQAAKNNPQEAEKWLAQLKQVERYIKSIADSLMPKRYLNKEWKYFPS